MEDELFLLVGFMVPDGADIDEFCFVVPVFADRNGKHFIQNPKLEKLYIPADADALELKVPVGIPRIDRRDDLLYGFLFSGHVLIGPYRLLVRELKEIQKSFLFHSLQSILIDHFINDMEKMVFANPSVPLMKFLIE